MLSGTCPALVMEKLFLSTFYEITLTQRMFFKNANLGYQRALPTTVLLWIYKSLGWTST